MVLALTQQHLVGGLHDLPAAMGYVGASLSGNGLARHMDAAVVGAADQQLGHVAVVATNNGIRGVVEAGLRGHPHIVGIPIAIGIVGRRIGVLSRRVGGAAGSVGIVGSSGCVG